MKGLLLLVLAAAAATAIWAAVRGAGRSLGTDYGPAEGIPAERAGDRPARSPRLRELDALLGAWPRPQREAARRLVDKYGPPDEAEARRLVWNDAGPWKKMTARSDGAGIVEFTAAYRVPLDRYELVAKLPGSVAGERGQEELTARAPQEAQAQLAIQLADEVLSGKRTLEDARAVYEAKK